MKRMAMLAVLVVVVAACGTIGGLRGMREVPAAQRIETAPPPGKAAVVFLRPSASGYTASIFELKKDTNVFAGHVPAFKKLLYVADPGTTRFLVSGQGADFLDATLDAGRTYYVLVLPATGAGFQFKPVTKADDRNFQRWFDDAAWVQTGPEAEAWAKSHAAQIDARRRVTMPRWEAKPDRPALRATDYR
jgi:hypothetical protein